MSDMKRAREEGEATIQYLVEVWEAYNADCRFPVCDEDDEDECEYVTQMECEDGRREALSEFFLDITYVGDGKWVFLSSTGGPACRMVVNRGQPEIQYQDWFTPWIKLPTTSSQDEVMRQVFAWFTDQLPGENRLDAALSRR